MSYTLKPLDLIEIQMVGRLDGQRTRSVFHYSNVGGNLDIPTGAEELLLLLKQFVAGPYNSIMGATSTVYTTELLQVQKISPTRFRAIQQTTDDLLVANGGTVVPPCEPSGVAVRLTFSCEPAGREFGGGKWFPAIPTSHITNSVLSNMGMLSWQDVATGLTQPLHGSPGAVYDPVIAHRLPLPLHGYRPVLAEDIIITCIVQPEARYQRRREVGKGE